MFFISAIVFFIPSFFFIFSVYLSSESTHSSLLYGEIFMIFIIITLNYLLGTFAITISFNSFSEFLSCSFDWNIFICFLILSDSLWFYILGRSAYILFWKEWSYVKGILCCLVMQHRWSPTQGVPRVFLCGLHTCSYCGLAVTDAGMLVGRVFTLGIAGWKAQHQPLWVCWCVG